MAIKRTARRAMEVPMRRSRLVAVMLGLIVLTGATLIMSGAPVQAGGQPSQIESDFRMVENAPFTKINTTWEIGAGSGTFTLNGTHLQNDNLKFNLEIWANGLLDNEEYYLTATLREGFDGTIGPVAEATAGTATTDGVGRLHFKGMGVFPASAFVGDGPWRIDQQVRIVGGVGGTLTVCFECVLVCRPTTKIELVDGKLVEFTG